MAFGVWGGSKKIQHDLLSIQSKNVANVPPRRRIQVIDHKTFVDAEFEHDAKPESKYDI